MKKTQQLFEVLSEFPIFSLNFFETKKLLVFYQLGIFFQSFLEIIKKVGNQFGKLYR